MFFHYFYYVILCKVKLTLGNLYLFQADFATSAVDFIHRIGRTGRAGQYGLVTSLYTESNRDLVAAVRRAEEIGQPVVIIFHTYNSDMGNAYENKISDMILELVM